MQYTHLKNNKEREEKGTGEEEYLRRLERRGFTALCAVLLNADQRQGGRGNPFVDKPIIKDDLAVIMSLKCAFFEFLNKKETATGAK